MQDLAYCVVNGKKILLLRRANIGGNTEYLKLRLSGNDGKYLHGASEYLTTAPETLARLLNSEVVCV